MIKLLLSCVLATGAAAAVALAAPAQAAPTAAASLECGETTVDVTGFGRGQVLHVVGTQQKFIVTRAETAGRVVFDAPGQAGMADIVDCTTTTPGGSAFAFRGFFTPRS